MSDLISGKEAKLAWANGEELEFYSPDLDVWFGLDDEPFMSDVFDTRPIRLKQKTITINGIEVPAPFEPKHGDEVWYISNALDCCYSRLVFNTGDDLGIGFWKSEEEIKQVVAALRSIFNAK